MHASEWFKANKSRARQLVARRDGEGASWKVLEREFGLPDANGMSAYRIYGWVTKEKPPSVRSVGGVKNYTFSLDDKAVINLTNATKYYRRNMSHALRQVLGEWATRHQKKNRGQ